MKELLVLTLGIMGFLTWCLFVGVCVVRAMNAGADYGWKRATPWAALAIVGFSLLIAVLTKFAVSQ